jgi:hypothetical protein
MDYFDRTRNEGLLVEAGAMAGSRYAEPFEATSITLAPCCCGKRRVARRGSSAHGNQAGIPGLALEGGKVVLEPSPCDTGALVVARNGHRV